MTVFTDEAGSFDLTLATPADWTIHTGDLPNGDNSASLSTTLNQNAVWSGEEFCLPAGSGSEKRTLEFWVKPDGSSSTEYVAIVKTDDTAVSGASQQWAVYINPTTNPLVAEWYNTSGGYSAYLQAYSGGAAAMATSEWHHVAVIFHCGATRGIDAYVDRALRLTASTPSGTPTSASTGTYKFFLGAARAGNANEITGHLAKVAFYDRALTLAEINAHYFRMVAT